MSEQMDILTELAHWLDSEGSLQDDDALERLGLDSTSRESSVITKPHALLTLSTNRQVTFKYPQMQAIYAANAVFNDWSAYGFKSTLEDLRRSALGEEVVEYLARLLDEEPLRKAWSECAHSPHLRRSPLVRRNLLAVAVANVDDLAEAATPQTRSTVLSRILGSRDLSDLHFGNITIERVDFRDWDLRRIHGKGGALLFCPNVYLANSDNTLTTLDSLDGSQVEDPSRRELERVDHGIQRLAAMLQPWCRKGSDTLVKEMSVASTVDNTGWACARKANFAVQARKYRGEKFWELTDVGFLLLQRFIHSWRQGDQGLGRLLRTEPDLRTLVLALSKSGLRQSPSAGHDRL